ncbi:oxidoreductase [Streptomyces mashuensis]|uniref:Oxidoreductase n=1 Tax=Streptomyces mashuensis TaxID=33904 RepID=A0A919B9Q0_9ACTN|nr:NADH-quinone oxidoreductase subunit NuoF family protein [Streptomyces mashuensis]GHF67863.1 oxidoreductase [Streptomyces mashuensis]
MTGRVPVLSAVGPPRLLAGLDRTPWLDLAAHLALHGPLPHLSGGELADLAEGVDLRGRGGAGFPFARKVRAVLDSRARTGPATAVVVNGSEGEPGCLKDTALLLHVPHLVLDGALLAAGALGAERVAVGVAREDVELSVRRAVAERGTVEPAVHVVRLPERFVTGEGSALIRGVGGGPALPSGRRVRSSESGLGGLPTLLSNTETFAQLAVAARLGVAGFRELGLPEEPGTVLLTVAGTHVVETPTGLPLPYALRVCGADVGQGLLAGGYHGAWLPAAAAAAATVSRGSLTAAGAVFGAGALLPLPEATCPVGETARVARWLAAESAGQCGPCFKGLPALAESLYAVARGGGVQATAAVQAALRAVERRGACGHPDGTARFVATSLAVFADDHAAHARGAGCGRPVLGALPLPEGVRGGEPRPAAARPPAPDERLVVDWTLCRGHGLCADLLPGILRLGPDGYPERAAIAVPARMRQRARRAVRRCPALALRVETAAGR